MDNKIETTESSRVDCKQARQSKWKIASDKAYLVGENF